MTLSVHHYFNVFFYYLFEYMKLKKVYKLILIQYKNNDNIIINKNYKICEKLVNYNSNIITKFLKIFNKVFKNNFKKVKSDEDYLYYYDFTYIDIRRFNSYITNKQIKYKYGYGTDFMVNIFNYYNIKNAITINVLDINANIFKFRNLIYVNQSIVYEKYNCIQYIYYYLITRLINNKIYKFYIIYDKNNISMINTFKYFNKVLKRYGIIIKSYYTENFNKIYKYKIPYNYNFEKFNLSNISDTINKYFYRYIDINKLFTKKLMYTYFHWILKGFVIDNVIFKLFNNEIDIYHLVN